MGGGNHLRIRRIAGGIMTGWIDGVYSKYHCEAPSGEAGEKCLKPARLRWFRDDNVPLCDECYRLLTEATP